MVKEHVLTEEQKESIRTSWKILISKGEVNVGKVFFKNIFTISPEML
jgi:hemoglobin-like flavoprotein